MKLMYKNPKTEIMTVNTEYMMLDATVSVNTSGGGGGTAHAPARHGDIID